MPISSLTCSACTAEVPASASYCPTCGTAVSGARYRATGTRAEGELGDAREADLFEHVARLQRVVGQDWEIRRLVGRGGYAEVYSAWDVRLKREVAIKTLRHDIPISRAVVERFRREAEAVAKLRHPHIIPIYTVGEGDGLVFFVMPLIDGESLAALLHREGRLPVPDACRILREAAGALAAAHRAGVIHRDVKPENILLEGPERRVIVMDFGIAKTDGPTEHKLTGTGLVVGTPQYMSPEQASGDRPADHRADQYALSIVGYQMLAGSLPFEASSVTSLLYKQVTETPAPLRAVRPEISSALAAVITRGLAKNPDARWPSMDEFATAIQSTEGSSSANTPMRTFRPVDMAKRAADARRLVLRWRLPAALAALLGLVVFLATRGSDTPRRAIETAGRRNDAEFAARDFLRRMGAPADAAQSMEFVAQDSVFELVQRAVPATDAQAVGASVGTWRWRLRMYDAPRNEVWSASVAPDGHVFYWRHALPDSTSGARLGPDSARALAERELRAHGWDPARLRFTYAAALPRPNRLDHTLAWARPDSVLRTPAGDSAIRMLEVVVAGDRATSYEERLDIRQRPAPVKSTATHLSFVIAFTSIAVMLLLSILLAVLRGRTDELQWGMSLRLTTISTVPLLVWFLVEQLRGAYTPDAPLGDTQAAAYGTQLLLALLVAGACVLFFLLVVVAAESLAMGRRPGLVAGLNDLSRGRLQIPEMASATVIGYGAGLLATGLAGAVSAMSVRWFGQITSSSVGDALGFTVPALIVPLHISAAIAGGVLLLYALTLASWMGARRWAPLLPAVVIAAFGAAYAGSPLGPLYAALPVLGICYIIWRYGVLTGIIAFFAAIGPPEIGQLLASGRSEFVMSGLVSAVLFFVPALFGWLAWRRMARYVNG